MNQRWGTLALLSALILAGGCGTTGHASPSQSKNGGTKKTAASKSPKKPASTVTKGGTLKVLGFWAHHKALPPSALGASNHSLTYLAPLWYSMTAHGTLKTKVDAAVLAEAKKQKLPIIVSVNDATGTQAFLTSAATRKAAVQSIDHVIAANHYAGVNIDFEPPHTHLKSELTAFMVELRDSLPRSDKIIVDVVPHSGGAYDFRRLAPEVTAIQLMSYDQHSDGTVAGPVAAMHWVTSITNRLKSQVPSSKIYLGIALYGYKWTSGSTHATTIPYDAITPAMKAKATWNTRYQEETATMGQTVYWWENRKGIAQKIALAKKDHLAGIALWQVGYATHSIYAELLKDVGKQP
ncbi:glycosyl hydrolase family 18 protein [Sulfobacillus harzensis]|uniref:Glycoside hydrolase n=1 Tax=Sulfobacillus harzensis TaxID=2729629 RepID=A0A7Y0L6B3_9FIRM|nr:glycosyl hydrolase family 18 protein [Sulfobacillus harzensis]NMP22719.1 glycoside hydrolase [Sulfobacillus harzensis]